MSLIKDNLLTVADKYNMTERTFDSFWNTYDLYLEEDTEEAKSIGLTDRNSIKAVLHSISYQSNTEYEFDAICISIRMYIENSVIGYYDMFFYENGDILDDYFVIE